MVAVRPSSIGRSIIAGFWVNDVVGSGGLAVLASDSVPSLCTNFLCRRAIAAQAADNFCLTQLLTAWQSQAGEQPREILKLPAACPHPRQPGCGKQTTSHVRSAVQSAIRNVLVARVSEVTWSRMLSALKSDAERFKQLRTRLVRNRTRWLLCSNFQIGVSGP